MQMYRVQFRVLHTDRTERGDVLVCASNKDAATAMVLALLKLPGSRTQCECERVKPSLYVIERRQSKLSEPKPSLRNHGVRK